MTELQRYLLLCLIVTLLVSLTKAQAPILIKNCILIDGTGGPAQLDSDIVIEGSRISKIGSDIQEPTDAIIFDCENSKTVLPGLTDMHGHLYGIGKTQLESYPILYLAGGVTTIFSPGEFEPNRIQKFRTSHYLGPDIYSAGPYFDRHPSMVSWIDGSSDSTSIVSKFNEWKSKIDGIKVYTSITSDQFELITKLARDNNLFITGHLGSTTAEFAISRGINGLEHGIEGFSDFVKFEGDLKNYFCELANYDLDGDEVENLIDLIIKNKVYIDPTMVLCDARRRNFRPVVADLYYFLDDSTEAYVKRSRNFRNRFYDQDCMEKLLTNSAKFVRLIYDRGGTIVTGTDPVSVEILPGYGIKREIELLVDKVGVPLVEAVQMASLAGCKILGINSDFGSIQEGKIANLSIIDGNPLDDIRALYRTETVFKNGKTYSTCDLLKTVENKISYGNWIKK